MSDPVQVALVAEGPTDMIVIDAALRAIFKDKPFVLKQIQPEGSLAFGPLGGGWAGVYKWCKQSALRGNGRVSDDGLVFNQYDFLILHVDVDVAATSYTAGNLIPASTDLPLPCAKPCPPAKASSDSLREVILSWCGETATPAKVVLCTPAQSTETWVLGALFHTDKEYVAQGECLPDPISRFSVQKKARRIRKAQGDYRNNSDQFKTQWPRICKLGEASRFDSEVLAATP